MPMPDPTDGAPPRRSSYDEDVEALLARVLERCRGSLERDSPRRTNTEGHTVLLDVEVGSLRCLIVQRSDPKARRVSFSPREREIGRMVAKGYTNKTIAAVLDISTWTVNTHLRRMFAKVGVHSRAALAVQLTRQEAAPRTGEPPRDDGDAPNAIAADAAAVEAVEAMETMQEAVEEAPPER